jgi:Family of unknown function (DUF6220)
VPSRPGPSGLRVGRLRLTATESDRTPFYARFAIDDLKERSLKALRAIYRYWLTILWLAVVAQIAGAAYGAFYTAQKLGDQSGSDESKHISEKVFDHGFAFHTAFGYLIFLGAVLLLLLSLAGRLGKRQILLSLAVPVLIALQIVLAWISEAVHGVGILHGINALLIFAFTGYLTGQQWRAARAATTVPELAAQAT